MVADAAPQEVPTRRPAGASGPAVPALVGAVAGLAWAASLRSLMTEIVGPESTVTWSGTFGWVLLPGVVVGALLGWAEHLRRTGGRSGWRWLAWSPLLFAAVLIPALWHPSTAFQGGIGGGAIGVPLIGIIGGYALSARGRVWSRVVAGLVFMAGLAVWALTAESVGGPSLALTTPHGAWVAVLYYSLLAVLALAAAIPQRPVVQARRGARATVAA